MISDGEKATSALMRVREDEQMIVWHDGTRSWIVRPRGTFQYSIDAYADGEWKSRQTSQFEPLCNVIMSKNYEVCDRTEGPP